jgi:hypothetical protein
VWHTENRCSCGSHSLIRSSVLEVQSRSKRGCTSRRKGNRHAYHSQPAFLNYCELLLLEEEEESEWYRCWAERSGPNQGAGAAGGLYVGCACGGGGDW